MPARDGLIAAYLKAGQNESQDDLWAWQELHELCSANSREAIDVVFALIDACESDSQLAYVVAGPVEDLLWSGNEENFSAFASACERSPKVLRALSMLAWTEEDPMFSRWKKLLVAYGTQPSC